MAMAIAPHHKLMAEALNGTWKPDIFSNRWDNRVPHDKVLKIELENLALMIRKTEAMISKIHTKYRR